MERTQASLFDPAQRAGCIFSAGWRPGSGRTARVTDKADGQTLYDSGIADAGDVDRAAAAAADAQRAWAATPPAARADVLRRFATCIEQHRGELANWIVRESGSFTGSTATGRRVGETAGRLLKRVALELGGNNALIVLDDVDLEAVSSAAAFGLVLPPGADASMACTCNPRCSMA